MHFLNPECMVNTPELVLNAGVCPIKLCSLTNWCAVMPFFMLKIVGGVGSNLGLSLFALLQMISCGHILCLLLPRAVCDSK